jgi:AcrR family transcriptional regulator
MTIAHILDPAASAAGRSGRNQHGQSMGSKGLKTRRRLVDATVASLETTGFRELKVIDIARLARSSPATFYVYFADVSDAVLAALSELSQSTPDVMAVLAEDADEESADATAQRLVVAYMAFWKEHRLLLRLRNLCAEEGDQRFVRARAAAVQPLLKAIANRVERVQGAGHSSNIVAPAAAAAAVIALLERLAVVIHTDAFGDEVSPESLMSASSYMIATLFRIQPAS